MGRTSNADERLMDAALALMWEESYGAVSIDDICQRANVKKGSFYYFFESKSELAVQALERYWVEQQKPAMDEIFSPARPPLERIRAKCEKSYRTQVEIQRKTGKVLGCRLCCLGSEICTQDEAIGAKVRQILTRQQAYWERAISDAQAEGSIPPGDAGARARCAIAFFEGLVAQARLHNDAEILRDLPDLMIDHLRAAWVSPSESAAGA
ncbi:MAG TPA: TetR/AcrR family transcriptional regulator [Candidatus Synoicihabitans sp.]|nr:TetR/AcrR family transcriptional regulator [Candidatus Synoicihabitans sp.]